ncbi:MAG: hypothetical protein GXO70_09060 [Acidobacteria bacterium]|nr:hypothetical protein [Acidobacteriota bacterium]
MTDSYDQHADYRYCNRGAAVYLTVEGFLWLLSATLGAYGQSHIAILLLIIGGMFIHPVSLGISRIIGLSRIEKSNPLPILNTWLALMIPLGLPLIFMAVSEGRTNLFYPAFTILIGAHWLPFIYIYAMKSFAVLAGVLVMIGIVFGFVLTNSFSPCGFTVGGVHLIFAIVNSYLVRAETPESNS